jgi:Tol biopolymer transport system component
VLTDNNYRDGDPAFSPDGAFISFETFRDGFSEA